MSRLPKIRDKVRVWKEEPLYTVDETDLRYTHCSRLLTLEDYEGCEEDFDESLKETADHEDKTDEFVEDYRYVNGIWEKVEIKKSQKIFRKATAKDWTLDDEVFEKYNNALVAAKLNAGSIIEMVDVFVPIKVRIEESDSCEKCYFYETQRCPQFKSTLPCSRGKKKFVYIFVEKDISRTKIVEAVEVEKVPEIGDTVRRPDGLFQISENDGKQLKIKRPTNRYDCVEVAEDSEEISDDNNFIEVPYSVSYFLELYKYENGMWNRLEFENCNAENVEAEEKKEVVYEDPKKVWVVAEHGCDNNVAVFSTEDQAGEYACRYGKDYSDDNYDIYSVIMNSQQWKLEDAEFEAAEERREKERQNPLPQLTAAEKDQAETEFQKLISIEIGGTYNTLIGKRGKIQETLFTVVKPEKPCENCYYSGNPAYCPKHKATLELACLAKNRPDNTDIVFVEEICGC